MSHARVEFSFPGRIEEIGPAADRILDALAAGDDIPFVVAIREALTNAVVHGCRGNAECQILCTTEIDGNDVLVTIKDPGEGFDFAHVADPTTAEGIMKFNGRGLLLIREGTDEVRFTDGGATIQLRKRHEVPSSDESPHLDEARS
jgi:serine/threonine-protein kinase RsbW